MAVLKAFKEENVLSNVASRGKELKAMLERLATDSATSHMVHDVRGLGLMLAIEFKTGSGYARKVQAKCMEKGLLLLTTSIYDTIRFMPALNISQEEMQLGIGIFEEAVREVATGAKPQETRTKGQAPE